MTASLTIHIADHNEENTCLFFKILASLDCHFLILIHELYKESRLSYSRRYFFLISYQLNLVLIIYRCYFNNLGPDVKLHFISPSYYFRLIQTSVRFRTLRRVVISHVLYIYHLKCVADKFKL